MLLEYGEHRIEVPAQDLIVGSDPGASLRLAGPDVLPRHAIVRGTLGGPAVIRPAALDARVLVNGALIGRDPAPLMHGDRVRIGAHELRVVDPDQLGATRQVAAAAAGSAPGSAAAPGASAGGGKGAAPSPPAGPVGRLVCLNDGREYAVVTPFGFGRDAVSSVVIASPDASRRHAEIVTGPEGDVLVDLSSNGTFVNGQRVSGRHTLRALDVIRIGAEEFRYYPPAQAARPPESSPPAGAEFRLSDTLIGIPTPRPMQAVPRPEPSPPSPLASLLVKRGERKGERFPIRSPIVNLGRADYNDVSLPDPSVSASHAKLQLREGVWLVTDLGSTNGTSVDDQPVTEETPLSPGCTLRVGEVHLLFEPRDEGVRATPGTTVLPRQEAPPPAPERRAPAAPREEPVLMPAGRPSSRSGVGIVIGVVVVAAAILAALVLLD